ncbi:hypothetical protein UFOVP244_110 [uncultured Caudovirales phage]|uniref:Lipoprotein n=1 Tax=uncultured Caudovirales phage TaxID=2100421 RepID=A0A6J7WX22_9CAUD|nr:hypothetical protein UFOVP244_110 [uncultured Caudovirales phage]
MRPFLNIKYFALMLCLVVGCATTSDVDQFEERLSAAKKRMEQTRYYLSVEQCRNDYILCRLLSGGRYTEEACGAVLTKCLTSAIDKYREIYGEDPPPFL